jgi:hypothetical protein
MHEITKENPKSAPYQLWELSSGPFGDRFWQEAVEELKFQQAPAMK